MLRGGGTAGGSSVIPVPNAPGWGVRGGSSVIPVSPVSPACGGTGGPHDTKCSGEGGQRGVRPSSRYQRLVDKRVGHMISNALGWGVRGVDERVSHMIPNAPGWGVRGSSSVIPVSPVSPVSPACGGTGGPYDTKCSRVGGQGEFVSHPGFPGFPWLVEERVGHMIPNAPGWGVRGDSSVTRFPRFPRLCQCSGWGVRGGSSVIPESPVSPVSPACEERVGHMIPNAPGRGVSGGFVRHAGTKCSGVGGSGGVRQSSRFPRFPRLVDERVAI